MADPASRRAYAGYGNGQIHYRIAGERGGMHPPLFLLHPTPKSGWIYERFMRRLARAGRVVIAPDTPGYGASDPLPDMPAIADFADANLALADHLVAQGLIDAGPVDVAGYHTGSVTSCQMALGDPDRVRRVIFFSLPMYDTGQRAEKLALLPQWPQPARDGSHIQRMWDLVGSMCDPRVDAAWLHRSVTENLRAVDTAAGYGAVYAYDLFAALPRLTHPAMLVNVGDDLYEQSRRAYPLLPRANVRELPELAHGMFDLDTELLAGIVEDFLG